MKKIIAIIGMAGLAVVSVHAQGYVIFSSNVRTISTNTAVFGGPGGKTQGVGNFDYALFWSSTITIGSPVAGLRVGTTDYNNYAFSNPGWNYDSDPTAVAQSTATAGRFTSVAPNGDSTTTVPGTVGGGAYHFVIIGWSANLGSSLAQLESSLTTGNFSGIGWVGQSVVSGELIVGDGALVGAPSVMGGADPFIQAFNLGLVIVPEPGTIALAVIGGASLLLLRRRK